MTTANKIALIAAGYVLAIGGAFGVVIVNSRISSAVDPQASSGMLAFGDAILFMLALVVFSLPASGAALWVLVGYVWRRNPR